MLKVCAVEIWPLLLTYVEVSIILQDGTLFSPICFIKKKIVLYIDQPPPPCVERAIQMKNQVPERKFDRAVIHVEV